MKLQNAKAAAEGVAAVAVLVLLLTIVGEVWYPLKDTLKIIFTHHWLGKSVLSAALFGYIYWSRKGNPADGATTSDALYLAIVVSSIASLAMLLFFVLHSLGIV